jgi:hypothetical protein
MDEHVALDVVGGLNIIQGVVIGFGPRKLLIASGKIGVKDVEMKHRVNIDKIANGKLKGSNKCPLNVADFVSASRE